MLERASVIIALPLRPGVGGGAFRAFPERRRKAREVVLAVEDKTPRLLVLEHVLHELRHEGREPRIDFLDAGFFCRRQTGSGTNEFEMMAFEHATIFVVEFQRGAALEEIVDPFEKPLVEQNSCFVAREARRHFARDLLKLGRRVCGFEIGENRRRRGRVASRFSPARRSCW